MRKKAAIRAIEQFGILLVYPIKNSPDPASLWSIAHPRKKMRWEWDDSGSDNVAALWHLREELSQSRKVIYTKWYKGRATFFSLPVFQALLALSLKTHSGKPISGQAKEILELLEEKSPLSTKQLKRSTNLVGRALEPTYTKALKELWDRFLIVAYGEVDEGAFPSLAIGATSALFEDLYLEAKELSPEAAKKVLYEKLRLSPELSRYYQRSIKPHSGA